MELLASKLLTTKLSIVFKNTVGLNFTLFLRTMPELSILTDCLLSRGKISPQLFQNWGQFWRQVLISEVQPCFTNQTETRASDLCIFLLAWSKHDSSVLSLLCLG